MFAVTINKENFEYDVNSIVRAFYPEEEVFVITPATGEVKREKALPDVKMEIVIGETDAVLNAPVSFRWTYQEEDGKFKDGFKRFLYRTLSQITGKTLPWGNLTGIRPTKIAVGMLEQGKSREEILEFYENAHYVSREKAELAVDIAKRERELLKNVHYEGGYSLYIGIPFCPSTCLYCSFTSYPIGAFRKQVDRYLDCVIKEMEYISKAYSCKILDSVYIGGGTPTTLEPEQLDRLIGKLKELFDFDTVQEFTVEAGRADSITEEKYALSFYTSNMVGTMQTIKFDPWVVRKVAFEDQVEVTFEGEIFSGPIGWDEYLTARYGDYMQLPPVEQRVMHSYPSYLK